MHRRQHHVIANSSEFVFPVAIPGVRVNEETSDTKATEDAMSYICPPEFTATTSMVVVPHAISDADREEGKDNLNWNCPGLRRKDTLSIWMKEIQSSNVSNHERRQCAIIDQFIKLMIKHATEDSSNKKKKKTVPHMKKYYLLGMDRLLDESISPESMRKESDDNVLWVRIDTHDHDLHPYFEGLPWVKFTTFWPCDVHLMCGERYFNAVERKTIPDYEGGENSHRGAVQRRSVMEHPLPKCHFTHAIELNDKAARMNPYIEDRFASLPLYVHRGPKTLYKMSQTEVHVVAGRMEISSGIQVQLPTNILDTVIVILRRLYGALHTGVRFLKYLGEKKNPCTTPEMKDGTFECHLADQIKASLPPGTRVDNPESHWLMSLRLIHMMGAENPKKVAQIIPTEDDMRKAWDRCDTKQEKYLLLHTLTDGSINQSVSKKVYQIIMNDKSDADGAKSKPKPKKKDIKEHKEETKVDKEEKGRKTTKKRRKEDDKQTKRVREEEEENKRNQRDREEESKRDKRKRDEATEEEEEEKKRKKRRSEEAEAEEEMKRKKRRRDEAEEEEKKRKKRRRDEEEEDENRRTKKNDEKRKRYVEEDVDEYEQEFQFMTTVSENGKHSSKSSKKPKRKRRLEDDINEPLDSS